MHLNNRVIVVVLDKKSIRPLQFVHNIFQIHDNAMWD